MNGDFQARRSRYGCAAPSLATRPSPVRLDPLRPLRRGIGKRQIENRNRLAGPTAHAHGQIWSASVKSMRLTTTSTPSTCGVGRTDFRTERTYLSAYAFKFWDPGGSDECARELMQHAPDRRDLTLLFDQIRAVAPEPLDGLRPGKALGRSSAVRREQLRRIVAPVRVRAHGPRHGLGFQLRRTCLHDGPLYRLAFGRNTSRTLRMAKNRKKALDGARHRPRAWPVRFRRAASHHRPTRAIRERGTQQLVPDAIPFCARHA